MEDQEEKEGTDWGELFGHAVRFMILVWSLAMMTLGYMDKIRNDGAFLAGLTSGVLGSYGISVNKKKNVLFPTMEFLSIVLFGLMISIVPIWS